jgi:hypothetical protein
VSGEIAVRSNAGEEKCLFQRYEKKLFLTVVGGRRGAKQSGVFPYFVNFDICTRNAKWKVVEVVFTVVELLN